MLVGLDLLLRGKHHGAKKRLAGAKLAVLTHAAACDMRGRSCLEVLKELGADVRVVFSPEHGLDGVQQAEVPVGKDDARVDAGVQLVSLYGADKGTLSPLPEHFTDIDVLLIDLVDVGARYYTYVWSALLTARAAAHAGVHTLVLDRPNPLSGNSHALEGRPQEPGFCSFVGLEPTPIRHSMTIAELLLTYFNTDDLSLGDDGAISAIACVGWERNRFASAWGRPFVPPSPNMPTAETALVYPGACLIEGTNLSEGRGTTTPFQTIGAPFLDAEALATTIGPISGAWVRPVRFAPSFDKHAGKVCGGVRIHVKNPDEYRPVRTMLQVLHAARTQAPDEFAFLDRVYEFESQVPAFDLLTGSSRARELLLSSAPQEELLSAVCPVDEEWVARVEAAEELLLELQS